MKTTDDFIKIDLADLIFVNKLTNGEVSLLKETLKNYAREVIDNMLMLGDDPEDGLIYSEMPEIAEALYNYEKIEKFKKELQ